MHIEDIQLDGFTQPRKRLPISTSTQLVLLTVTDIPYCKRLVAQCRRSLGCDVSHTNILINSIYRIASASSFDTDCQDPIPVSADILLAASTAH